MKTKIIVKNKKTQEIEKLSPKEYRNINDKIPLTIENLKKHNNTIKVFLLALIGILILGFIIVFIPIVYDIDFSSINKTELISTLLICLIVLLIPIIILVLIIKKTNKTKKYINEGKFKIVEDKIYDKYFEMNSSLDNGATYNYYVCTKIYGYQEVEAEIYDICEKNDSIYLLMCNGNEKNNEVIENRQKELKRNSKNTYQNYLAVINPLSDELKKYFIPYDDKLGEFNYKKRIKNKINELSEKKYKVNCKKCKEKYNLRNNEVCPKCGEKYNFDITDVIEYKDWL